MHRIVLSLSFVPLCLLLTLAADARPQKDTKQPEPQKHVMPVPKPVEQKVPPVEERIQSWLGQKVVLLNPVQGWASGFHRFGSPGSPEEDALAKDYAGKTGVIVDVVEEKTKHGSKEMRFVVALDGSGEKLVAGESYFGFLAEMEAAKNLIGKSVWSRGRMRLVKDFVLGMSDAEIDQRRFWSKNTERLTITRAEWGDDASAIYLCFKSTAGEEGCRYDSYYGGYIEAKFARRHQRPWYKTIDAEQFYFEDPRKKFPGWHKGIWELIERQEVAIGMTTEMVELVCSEGIIKKGTVLSMTSAEDSGVIADCRGGVRAFPRYEFLLQGGKVVKFIQ